MTTNFNKLLQILSLGIKLIKLTFSLFQLKCSSSLVLPTIIKFFGSGEWNLSEATTRNLSSTIKLAWRTMMTSPSFGIYSVRSWVEQIIVIAISLRSVVLPSCSLMTKFFSQTDLTIAQKLTSLRFALFIFPCQ